VKLDAVKPGEWFAKQFADMIGAEKTLVQKSGYFSRAAAANAEDRSLIKSCTDYAVECALRNESGVIGHDEDNGGVLRAIEFPRIKGGKPFDPALPWFVELLSAIGQGKDNTSDITKVASGLQDRVKMLASKRSRRMSSAFSPQVSAEPPTGVFSRQVTEAGDVLR